jgi:hypothetical protein
MHSIDCRPSVWNVILVQSAISLHFINNQFAFAAIQNKLDSLEILLYQIGEGITHEDWLRTLACITVFLFLFTKQIKNLDLFLMLSAL